MAGRGRSFVRKSADSIKQPKIYMADGLKFKSKSLYDLYYLLKELQKEKLITCFELPTLTEQKQKTKFGSMKCMIDNRVFDSVMEAKFYIYVKKGKREGNIKDFDCQVTFLLQESFKKNGKTVRPITYIADFVIEHLNGTKMVIDVKGRETADFKIKHKMFEYHYRELELICVQYDNQTDEWVNKKEAQKEKKAIKKRTKKVS